MCCYFHKSPPNIPTDTKKTVCNGWMQYKYPAKIGWGTYIASNQKGIRSYSLIKWVNLTEWGVILIGRFIHEILELTLPWAIWEIEIGYDDL